MSNRVIAEMSAIQLPQEVWNVWDEWSSFLNSAFLSAFLSSLAGAGAGVLGAQWVSDRSAKRTDLRTALQQANAATVLAASMVNILGATKRQLIEPLTLKYEADRAEALAAWERLASGQRVDFKFEADFLSISPVQLPNAELGRLTYGNPRTPAQAIATMAMVDQAINELNYALAKRVELIGAIRSASHEPLEYARLYFGLPRRDGNVDSMYPDAMGAIAAYANDALFFTSYLSRRTQAHAEQLATKLAALDGAFNPARGVSRVSFSAAQEAGIVPRDAEYAAWLATFEADSRAAEPSHFPR